MDKNGKSPAQDDCIQKVTRFEHVLGASLIFDELRLGIAHRRDEINKVHVQSVSLLAALQWHDQVRTVGVLSVEQHGVFL